MSESRLLIVDPTANPRADYALGLAGLEPRECVFESDSAAAERRLADESFDALVVGVRTPGDASLEVVERLRRRDPTLPIVLIGPPALDNGARAALHSQADEVLTAPLARGVLVGAATPRR